MRRNSPTIALTWRIGQELIIPTSLSTVLGTATPTPCGHCHHPPPTTTTHPLTLPHPPPHYI